MADHTQTQLTKDDEGKTLVDTHGEGIGEVIEIRGVTDDTGGTHRETGPTLIVDTDPSITDTIKSALGWGDQENDEDVYQFDDPQVERVTNDEITIAISGASEGSRTAGDTGHETATHTTEQRDDDPGIGDDNSRTHDEPGLGEENSRTHDEPGLGEDSSRTHDDSGITDDDDGLFDDDDDHIDDDSRTHDDDDGLLGDDDGSRTTDSDTRGRDKDSRTHDNDESIIGDDDDTRDDDGLLGDDDDDEVTDDELRDGNN